MSGVRAVNGGRYLRYDERIVRPHGMNHWIENLECLLAEAHFAGRLAVLPALRLDPRHNLGVDRDWEWETYFDLAASRLVPADGRPQPLPVAVAESADGLPATEVEPGQTVPPAAAEAPLVVRSIRSRMYHQDVPAASRSPHPAFRFAPSARVRALAGPALAAVRERAGGSHAAVHVRRGDRFRHLPVLLGPWHLSRRLRRLGIADGAAVLFLSDERNPRFWAGLGRRYAVARSADLPELKALVAGPAPDNYLLYEVEKQLFRAAALRVETAAGGRYEPAHGTLLGARAFRWSERLRRAINRLAGAARRLRRPLRGWRD